MQPEAYTGNGLGGSRRPDPSGLIPEMNGETMSLERSASAPESIVPVSEMGTTISDDTPRCSARSSRNSSRCAGSISFPHVSDANDPLHWPQPAQNWNHTCAECHSTSWAEIDVSCEACHGPGSDHIEWARDPDRVEEAADETGMGLRVGLQDPPGHGEFSHRRSHGEQDRHPACIIFFFERLEGRRWIGVRTSFFPSADYPTTRGRAGE